MTREDAAPDDAGPGPPLSPPADFVRRALELGVEFDAGDVERLGLYLALLLHTNKTHNLTAITDPLEAWTKHILDALTLVGPIAALSSERDGDAGSEAESESAGVGEPGPAAVNVPRATPGPIRVADVGAGGGVPGIPLAIVMPGVHFTLIESTLKKAEFLRGVVRRLGLKNTTVVAERVERVGQDHRTHRERYDAGIARALGHLAIVAELAGPLVRPGGVVLAVKGAKAETELEASGKAMGMLGLRHVQTIPTPTGRIVVLEKTTRTPRLYPRRDGEPKRRPLGIPVSRAGDEER